MANEEHLAILAKGVSVWNEWRRNNPEITPELSSADLQGMYLECVNFENANLSEANLSQCSLRWARFDGAILDRINIDGTDVSGTTLATMLEKQRLEKQRHERLEKQRHEILEAHKQFLKSRNLEHQGVRFATVRQHRVTHCWNCKEHLDNSIDLECLACGWILCRCGACGCSYGR